MIVRDYSTEDKRRWSLPCKRRALRQNEAAAPFSMAGTDLAEWIAQKEDKLDREGNF